MNHHLDLDPIAEGLVERAVFEWDEGPTDEDWAFYFEAMYDPDL